MLLVYTAKCDTSVITNDSLYVNEAPSEINVNNGKGNNYYLVLKYYLLKYVLAI